MQPDSLTPRGCMPGGGLNFFFRPVPPFPCPIPPSQWVSQHPDSGLTDNRSQSRSTHSFCAKLFGSQLLVSSDLLPTLSNHGVVFFLFVYTENRIIPSTCRFSTSGPLAGRSESRSSRSREEGQLDRRLRWSVNDDTFYETLRYVGVEIRRGGWVNTMTG